MKPLAIAATALGALSLTAAGCITYGIAVEQHSFRLRRLRVPILPTGHEPIKVLHISDLHLIPSQAKKILWVRALADLQPDFIVNTGDNIASPDALLSLAKALTPLSERPGVFVFGSNDYHGPRAVNPFTYLWRPSRYSHLLHKHRELPSPDLFHGADSRTIIPTDAIVSLFDSAGWVNAEQQRHTFTIHDTTIEVRGCSDAHMGADDYPAVMGGTNADLLISVTHSPYVRVLNQMVADGAGLIFAGHTHGGQVCLPTGRALTTNCDLPTAQAKGLSTHIYEGSWSYLHVSAGLGTSPNAPYRFFCPPEASLVTLVPRPEF